MPSFMSKPSLKLRPLFSDIANRASPRLTRLLARPPARDLDNLSKRVILPSLPIADEDITRITLWEKGRKLARQDRWDELENRVQLADDARLCTPGGLPEAILLVLGAHSDAVNAAQDTLNDGNHPNGDGIEALEEVLLEMPGAYVPAVVVALAHLRIARAWKEAGHNQGIAEATQAMTQAETHQARAQEILLPFDAEALDAPSLAATKAAMLETQVSGMPGTDLIKAYRALIALDHDSPQHMRDYGLLLSPTSSGEPDLLENEARYITELTDATWNGAGYVWMYLNALASDPLALNALDTDRFVSGVRAVMDQRPSQHIVNEIAALFAVTMAPGAAVSKDSESKRAALYSNLDWILSRHLHELHPRLWTMGHVQETLATPRHSHRAIVAQGRKTALNSIASFFADQIEDGSSIAFSPVGMYRLPAI